MRNRSGDYESIRWKMVVNIVVYQAAAAFFATPPEATIDEALRDFLAVS